jgi:WD40 repeat protein
VFVSDNKGVVCQFTVKKFEKSQELTPFNTVRCHDYEEIASMTVSQDNRFLFTASKESLMQWDLLT